MTTNLNFRVSKVLLGQFEEVCQSQGLNKSEVLRSLMAGYVQENQKGEKKMSYKKMVEKATNEIGEEDYTELVYLST